MVSRIRKNINNFHETAPLNLIMASILIGTIVVSTLILATIKWLFL